MCQNEAINGVTQDGGYAEYVLLRTEAVVSVPEDVDPAEYAPILCAGITVFNSIRKLNLIAGEVVAVQGLGGLGHLAVQYAAKLGHRVVALSSGDGKRDFAKQLGAHDYINTSKQDPCEELMKLGGAAAIVCTAPNPKAIGPLVGGIQAGGSLLILAIAGKIEVDTTPMIQRNISVVGYPSGHALDCEEAIAFTKLHGIKCLIERFPLKDANKAYEHMVNGDVRFRSVLVME
jgi:D-arabinose 1-dehydrogenase-like Zn-dependent alcohol dehydrogenase